MPWPLATSYPINLGNIILFAETWISVTLLWETTSLVFPFVRLYNIPLSSEHGHGNLVLLKDYGLILFSRLTRKT